MWHFILQETGHQVTLTIEAIFDNGINSFMYKFWYVFINQSVMVTSLVVCSHCYVTITPQTFKELLSIVCEVRNHDGNGLGDVCLL